MCGILGWVGPGAAPGSGDFAAALDLLAHRGPDDRGVHAEPRLGLGHRRLSIIDLSSAGHQPMVDAETEAVIVFNGEINNYLELRQELETLGSRFRTRTDTEVLLQSYLQWGRDCLARLNGMWSFAIWLPKRQRLFFARDRFGVKPFYFVRHGGCAFASEPKALPHLFPSYRQVDAQKLYDFWAEGRFFASNRSYYRGVEVFPLAHCGEFDAYDKTLRIKRYWDYPNQVVDCDEKLRAAEELQALFEDTVRIRLRSHVPVGVSLSGGSDSTAVLAAPMRVGTAPRVRFTSVYGEGQVADEALGGYPEYGALYLLEDVRQLLSRPSFAQLETIVQAWCLLSCTFASKWVILWLLREIFPVLVVVNRSVADVASVLREEFSAPVRKNGEPSWQPSQQAAIHHRDRVTVRRCLDHCRGILPGLLHCGEAISMAHSIEARPPFLDYRLMEWLFARSADIKISEG